MTRGLLSAGAQKVVAIEKDPRCILALKELKKHYCDRLEIIEGDATKIDQEKYFTKPVKVIANLPYNIGTKLLIEWLTVRTWPSFWHSLTLMFQNEVAEITEITEEEVQDLEQELGEALDNQEKSGTKLPENIEKLVSFMEETGGTLEDYVRLNRDYSNVNETALLKEYYKKTKHFHFRRRKNAKLGRFTSKF